MLFSFVFFIAVMFYRDITKILKKPAKNLGLWPKKGPEIVLRAITVVHFGGPATKTIHQTTFETLF